MSERTVAVLEASVVGGGTGGEGSRASEATGRASAFIWVEEDALQGLEPSDWSYL